MVDDFYSVERICMLQGTSIGLSLKIHARRPNYNLSTSKPQAMVAFHINLTEEQNKSSNFI